MTQPLFTVGSTLHHYRLLEEIGGGAMGRLFLAEDTRLHRRVALKMLPPGVVADPARCKRFQRESQALATLNHPNVVTLHDVEEVDGQPFLVMEWIEGRTLEELIPVEGLPLSRCLDLAIPMVEGVAKAHQAGIVHRDLKPANVMVRDDDVVKVVDFGIARMALPPTVAEGPAESRTFFHTAEGVIVGTVPYMSPQQLEGLPVDARSDIFSLGVILFEMATGRRPFVGASSASIISSILRDAPPRLTDLRPSLPAGLERIVDRCLAKHPEDRYGAVAELRQDLVDLRREIENPSSALMAAPTLTSTALSAPTLLAAVEPAAPARRRPRLPTAAMLVAALLLLAGAGLWLARSRSSPAVAAAAPRAARGSIAVLPLRNLSQDRGQEYFSDGTTEAVIAELAKVGGLRVTSRDSVMSYRDRHASLSEVARLLGVEHILDGSVARSGDEVMIIVQLVDPTTGGAVWGDTFRGDIRQIFDLQQRVAEAVARAARGVDVPARLPRAREVAPQVYELYLRARYLLNQRTSEGARKALELIDQALAQDPRYALAWAVRAECYVYLVSDGLAVMPAREGLPVARQAALRAIELDESLSEAHVMLAFVDLQSWDWQNVEREFRRAIELNPSNADAYHKLTMYLTAQGRHDEAVATIGKARQLDPLSLAVNIGVAANYQYAGRLDEAAAAAEATISLQPGHWIPYLQLGEIHTLQGRYEAAEAQFRKALRLSPHNPYVLTLQGLNEIARGRSERARQIQAELLGLARAGYLPPSLMARLLFRLGDADQGFVWLQRAVDARDPSLLFLRIEPDYRDLRRDPRFQHVLDEVGLPRF